MSGITMAVMVHTYLSMPYSSRHSSPTSNIRPWILALANWCCGLGLLMRILGLKISLTWECRYNSSWQNFRDRIMNGNESTYFSPLFMPFDNPLAATESGYNGSFFEHIFCACQLLLYPCLVIHDRRILHRQK